jgi:hypothetical protein
VLAAADPTNKDTQMAASDAAKAYLLAVEHASDPQPTPFTDAISAAGRKLLGGLPHVGRDDVSLTLGAVGWMLLAGLALFGYRTLEARTGRGELLLAKPDTSGNAKPSNSDERFRTYVSRNIPEPAAVPGASSTLKPVTDLLAAATGGGPATLIGKLLSGAADAIKAPRGATASVTILADGAADKSGSSGTFTSATDADKSATSGTGKPTSVGTDKIPTPASMSLVAVRVSPAASGVEVQKTFTKPALDDALRAGAYWAAAILMERSHRVPPWALWSPDASEALATYYAQLDTGAAPSLDSLEDAVHRAPRSGLLLLELANRYAVEGRLVDAFAMNLRAVTLYPRWPVARYRLAATAEMLADRNVADWQGADDAAKDAIRATLCRGDIDGADALEKALANDSVASTMRRELCTFAIELLDPKKTVGLWRVTWRALRAPERSYWFSLFRTRQHVSFRRQFAELAKSARVIGQVRAPFGGADLEDLNESWGNQDDLSWQLVYNLACARAERAGHPTAETDQDVQVARALDLLEMAVTRPGGHQLTYEWLESDPDLAILRDTPRFARLLEQLPRNDEKKAVT